MCFGVGVVGGVKDNLLILWLVLNILSTIAPLLGISTLLPWFVFLILSPLFHTIIHEHIVELLAAFLHMTRLLTEIASSVSLRLCLPITMTTVPAMACFVAIQTKVPMLFLIELSSLLLSLGLWWLLSTLIIQISTPSQFFLLSELFPSLL